MNNYLITKQNEQAKAEYVIAKAKADCLKEIFETMVKPINDALDREELTIEEWAEKTTDTEYKIGYVGAKDELWEATKKLVNWLCEEMLKVADEEQRKDIEFVRDNWRSYPSIHNDLIEVALRLKV